MNARQLFEVLLRVIGVWGIVNGIERLPMWIDFIRVYMDVGPASRQQVNGYMMASVVGIVCGLLLYFLARPIANRTFPDESASSLVSSAGESVSQSSD